jgi:AcrR family transcriptional regulator
MPRGGKRTFDANAALEKALDLFARQGYEGTSIAELTQVMGINPPSLYAAFGNKRHLFDLVVERYGEHRRPYLEEVLAQPTAQLAAERYLIGAVEYDTAPGQPPGCLTVQACLACDSDERDVADQLADVRRSTQETMQRRFEQGLAEGDLSTGTDCAALARFLSTVDQGISVQASGGASRDQLLEVVAIALAAFPERPRGRRASAAAEHRAQVEVEGKDLLARTSG